MKVCIVGPGLKMGGMERASVNLANSLHLENHDVTYVSLFRQEHFFKLNEHIVLIEPNGFNSNSLSLIKTIIWLRSIVKKLNPDCILVFNKLYGAITCLSLIWSGFKVFISERSSPFYQWPKSQQLIINFIFTFVKPYGVISQTNIAKENQIKYFGSNVKIEVIPNALRNVQIYSGINRQKIILAVGRLNDPLKGFDRLLRAFAMTNGKDWVLQIAGGDDKDDPSLDKIITEENLGGRIQFLGKVKDIDRVFATASIFVIPSRSEGFPNALCEAMASGLACISYDFIAGPRDIIEHNENGILVEDGNITLLAAQMQKLMENETERLRLGANATLISQKFSGKIISKKISIFLNNE